MGSIDLALDDSQGICIAGNLILERRRSPTGFVDAGSWAGPPPALFTDSRHLWHTPSRGTAAPRTPDRA